MAGRFELLLAGDQEQRPRETELVPSGVIEVEGMCRRQRKSALRLPFEAFA
jgi:hypothetical protein